MVERGGGMGEGGAGICAPLLALQKKLIWFLN